MRTLRQKLTFSSAAFLLLFSALPVLAGVNRWTASGPAGYFYGVVFDPFNENRALLAAEYGLFETRNAGFTWSLVMTGTFFLPAYDPTRPGVIYVGDTDGGVWKSTDGGRHWTLYQFSADLDVIRIAVDPSDPDVLYAGTSYSIYDHAGLGVFKSTDGGETWVSVGRFRRRVWHLAIDPSATNVVYSGSREYGVSKTTDAGATWEDVNEGLPKTGSFQIKVLGLALDSDNPQTLYAALGNGGVYKTTDGAASWQAVGPDATVHGLTMDPSSPTTLYAGTDRGDVYKTTDGAMTWNLVSAEVRPEEIEILAVDPWAPDHVFASTFGDGLFESVDGGATWSLANRNLSNSSIGTLAVDPWTPGVVYAGSNRLFKTVDGGLHWDRIAEFFPWRVAIDPKDPETVYATTYEGTYKTTNGGDTWSPAGWTLRAGIFVIDPTDSSTLYATSNDGIYKTVDGGGTWVRVHVPIDVSAYQLERYRFLAVDPQTPTTLYTGQGGEFLKSADGGASWSTLDVGSADGYAQAVAIDPTSSSSLFVSIASDDDVYKSVDGGTTWERVLEDFRAEALLIDPAVPSTVFAGGKVAMRSLDGGRTWHNFSVGLYSAPWILKADPTTPGRVYAGTAIGGVASLTQTPMAVGGHVWRDDGDGVQEAGESGLGGVTVNLLDSDGNWQLRTVTDEAGGV